MTGASAILTVHIHVILTVYIGSGREGYEQGGGKGKRKEKREGRGGGGGGGEGGGVERRKEVVMTSFILHTVLQGGTLTVV